MDQFEFDYCYKQLSDEVFVISRINKVEVEVFSGSRRLRLITLTETRIILDIPKTESYDCFIIYSTKTNWSHVFASSLTASNTKRANLTWLPLQIMHRGHTWYNYPWPWMFLTCVLYDLQLQRSWHYRRWFRQFTVRFQPNRKEIVNSMYNKTIKFLKYS